jgi:hypothetical protein
MVFGAMPLNGFSFTWLNESGLYLNLIYFTILTYFIKYYVHKNHST